ncbi:MAG: hypothetical protein Q8P64_24840 [Deltaproteobacteria bacterium]|nr:hypothetical protein [Deltaproteobacteria bacterium]
MTRQFRVTLGPEAEESLDAFCEASGASRSDVVDKLVQDYLEELCKDVAALTESEEDEEEDTDEDEDEEEEEKTK